MKYLLMIIISFIAPIEASSMSCREAMVSQKKPSSDKILITKKLRDKIKVGKEAEIKQALEQGADPNYQGSEMSNTALHLVAYNEILTKPKMVKVAKILLESNINVQLLNNYNETALDSAIVMSNDHLANFLKKQGVPSAIKDMEAHKKRRIKEIATSRLLKGVVENNLGTVNKALAQGADVNFQSKGAGHTLLHWVVFKNSNSTEIIETVLNAGAEINAVNNYGKTPLDIAYIMGDDVKVKFLKNKGGKTSKQVQTYFNDKFTGSLISGIIEGDLLKIKNSIFNGVNVNVPDKITGAMPLHLVARTSDNPEIANVLLRAGAQIHAVNPRGEIPLEVAFTYNNDNTAAALLEFEGKSAGGVKADVEKLKLQISTKKATKGISKNDLFKVREAISKGINADYSDKYGNTFLHHVALNGSSPEIAQAFLEAKANINIKNIRGRSPLDIVYIKMAEFRRDSSFLPEGSISNYQRLAKFLKSQGAISYIGDVDLYLKEDARKKIVTGIMHNDPKLVEYGIKLGADIHAKNRHGSTFLHVTAYKDKGKNKDERVDMVRALLDAGAEINEVNNYYETALDLALFKGNIELANFLRSRGGVISSKSEVVRKEISANGLFESIESGDIIQMYEEIALGVDVNAINEEGNTALHLVARTSDDIEMAQALLDAGAQINLKNKRKETALDLAVTSAHTELIKLFSSKGGEFLESNRKEISSYIVENHESISIEDLFNSIKSKDLDQFRRVIKEVNVNDKNDQGETALHILARTDGSVEMAQALVDAGARINVISFKGEMAFDVAIKHKKEGMIEFFKNQEGAIAHQFPNFVKSQVEAR